MKKIITTVGTSLFTNYQKPQTRDSFDNYKSIDIQFENLQDLYSKKYDEEDSNIKHLIKIIKSKWFENEDREANIEASAEIKSIIEITKQVDEDVDVYLLATDTVLSLLSCILIEEWFTKYKSSFSKVNIKFNPTNDIIESLQIKDAKEFKKGLVNINNRFYNITEGFYENVILNITGGYKALIPYLTLLGQINKTQIKYIFEDTNIVITIPQIPISLDENIFEEYWKDLEKLDEELLLNKSDYHEIFTKLESFFEEVGNQFGFNYLGEALWEKYKSNFFMFYAEDECWNDIQTKKEIKKIITEDFHVSEQRTKHNKAEPNEHKTVYKKSRTELRIYYFIQKESIYLYKVFDNHLEHENYFNNKRYKLDEEHKQLIIENAKLRKIKIG